MTDDRKCALCRRSFASADVQPTRQGRTEAEDVAGGSRVVSDDAKVAVSRHFDQRADVVPPSDMDTVGANGGCRSESWLHTVACDPSRRDGD